MHETLSNPEAFMIDAARSVALREMPNECVAYGGVTILRETVWATGVSRLDKWLVQTGDAGAVEGCGATLTEALADAIKVAKAKRTAQKTTPASIPQASPTA